MLKSFLKENKMTVRIITVIAGGALGFAYYKFIDCRTGSCPLTSNPYISILWGSLMGFIISG
ncbi:hypothetical protein KJ762_03290 [bacterium]|nr:hypothetical protein [bacterium]MBU1633517.1 hypothetical protein [bacterium]MBU1874979.1 hypothetical protein [bacterium]